MISEAEPSASTALNIGKNHSTGLRYTTSRMRMTTSRRAMSRVPSIPLNESMKATNRPPGAGAVHDEAVRRVRLGRLDDVLLDLDQLLALDR